MSDLVNYLRSYAGDVETKYGITTECVREAAAEIERLRERLDEECLAANSMAADLSRFVDVIATALCEVGGWDEIDGDGSPESILCDRIRDVANHNAPKWWDE